MNNHEKQQPSLYVGVGASAGGLEAIEQFFSHIPADSGMAFVVIQHLSPDYKSLMVELLSKKTEMEVLRAEDQMLVEANKIYLIPPKKNMTIFHGRLLLKDQEGGHGPNLPIDIFLTSLAQDQNMQTAAVILSGTGSDGMRGVKAIKEAGGLILVQDENSAKFDGMPRSAISTGLTDFILRPAQMFEALTCSLRDDGQTSISRIGPDKLDHENITRIFALLRARTGVDFTFYKPSTILRRLERRMNLNQIRDLNEYTRHLESFPQEVSQLYKELLIGVTSFFRDPEVFKYLEENLIPEIVSNAGTSLRIWVPGCSTGEEAYSYAMLFADYLAAQNLSKDIKIFATDIDKDAILKAGQGIFPESSALEIGQNRLLKYFQIKNDKLHVCRSLREMVVFAQHNLIKDPPFTNIDLVSCRNLLIYLQPVLQKKAISMFQFALKPSRKGYLVLGNSETPGENIDFFAPLDRKLRIYNTFGHKSSSSEGSFLQDFVRRKEQGSQTGRSAKSNVPEEKVLDRFLQSLTDEEMPLIILINEESELLYLSGDAGDFLAFPSGRMNNNLLKLAHSDISIPLSTGIQKVLNNHSEVAYKNVSIKRKEQSSAIDILIRELPKKRDQERLLAVLIRTAHKYDPATSNDSGETYDLNQGNEQRIKDLEQELQFTKENLQATIEELETSNEELQATNEELLSSNEELQSTNEELQSVNEELFTVNSEYQQKIIELTELNNDIDNLLMATDIGTIFLDENLEIRKFTPYVNRVLKVMEHDVGRPFSQLSHHVGNIDLMEIVERVVNASKPESIEYRGPDNNWFLIKVLPYKIAPRAVSGVVLSFIDINRVKSFENSYNRESELMRLVGDLAEIGGWEVNLQKDQIYWSSKIYQIYGVTESNRPEDVMGQMEFYPPEARERLGKALDAAKVDGTRFDLTLPFKNSAGEKLKVRVLGRGIKENDKIVKIQGTLQDVSEKLSEDASENRIKTLLSAITDWNEISNDNPVSEKDICKRRARFIAREAALCSCWIALADKKVNTRLKIVASDGIDDAWPDNSKKFTLPEEPDRLFTQSFYITDLQKVFGPAQIPEIINKGNHYIFPLKMYGEFYGLLGIILNGEKLQNHLELQILHQFASNLTVGIHIARLGKKSKHKG